MLVTTSRREIRGKNIVPISHGSNGWRRRKYLEMIVGRQEHAYSLITTR